MSKARNWPTRVLHVVFALALVVGLAVTAAPPVAQAGTPANPGSFTIDDGMVSLGGTSASGIPMFGGFDGENDGIEVGWHHATGTYKVWQGSKTGSAHYTGTFSADVVIAMEWIEFCGEFFQTRGEAPQVTVDVDEGELTIHPGGTFTLTYQGDDLFFEKQGKLVRAHLSPR